MHERRFDAKLGAKRIRQRQNVMNVDGEYESRVAVCKLVALRQ